MLTAQTRPAISEIVTQGPSTNGPALAANNGLSSAQSAAAAQHDPYATNYGSYPAVVNGGYGTTYSPAGMNPLASSYYAQPPSQAAPQPPTPQQQHQPHPHAHPHTAHPDPPSSHDQSGLHHDHSHIMREHFPDSEIRFTQQIEHQQQQQQQTQGTNGGHAHTSLTPPPPPTPIAGPSHINGNGKRKEKPASAAANGTGSGDEGAPPPKRRRPPARPSKDGENVVVDDDDVGPGGGAKHWSVEEKSRLFSWILEDDERWEMFGSKMNVIFREGSEKLFNSRKSFTALKSCYHRNLDVFKQIWLFETFLTRPPSSPRPPASSLPSPGTPSSSASTREVADILHAPVPASFDSAQERQVFLDKKLDAARALEVPIANLGVKVIDNWHERGWYVMFKRRFKEDAKTGLPVPAHDGSGAGGGNGRARAQVWSAIPPPLPKNGQSTHAHAHGHAGEDVRSPRMGGATGSGAGMDGEQDGDLVDQATASPHTPVADMHRRHLAAAEALVSQHQHHQHAHGNGHGHHQAHYAGPSAPKAVMSRASTATQSQGQNQSRVGHPTTPTPSSHAYSNSSASTNGNGSNSNGSTNGAGHHALPHTPSAPYSHPAHPHPHAPSSSSSSSSHLHHPPSHHTPTPYTHSAQSSPQLSTPAYPSYPPPPSTSSSSSSISASTSTSTSASSTATTTTTTAAAAPFYPSPPAEYHHPPPALLLPSTQPASLLPAAAHHHQHAQPQPQDAAAFQVQTLQALSHLTSVTQTLTELVRAQVEDGRARTELLRRREDREAQGVVGAGAGMGGGGGGGGGGGRSDRHAESASEGLGRTQKASLAVELLSNPGVGDEIKAAAADYLKKLFQ